MLHVTETVYKILNLAKVHILKKKNPFTMLQHKIKDSTIIIAVPVTETRGPWVAHLRKRSNVTMEPIIENPRVII